MGRMVYTHMVLACCPLKEEEEEEEEEEAQSRARAVT